MNEGINSFSCTLEKYIIFIKKNTRTYGINNKNIFFYSFHFIEYLKIFKYRKQFSESFYNEFFTKQDAIIFRSFMYHYVNYVIMDPLICAI